MNTYERVLKMSRPARLHFVRQADKYGLACTCKSGYCAKHDEDLQKLIERDKEEALQWELEGDKC